ncbi:hypothetical protein [Tepidibacter formicigenes]|uniref:Uncharacterized protein n=1 Tax=Tepidibacter formicigenes DSM 15518 TaxID=1123349 RepID=A0A1M6SF11_9FIRM|nr:hypothetical protein [Tepidibacter formicigenes]SHK43239.1 hypothetical protein SAMN02744037_02328 [Tepidibacter formicigenes DSM 15518]
MNTADYTLPSPKFIIFHHFIKWFIDNFGIIPYFLIVVGSIFIFCLYALIRSVNRKQWDKTIMIILFTMIIVGGLLGLGFDVHNGYPITLI